VAQALAQVLDRRWLVHRHFRSPVGGQFAVFDAYIDILVAERGTRMPLLVIDTKHKTQLVSADVYQVAFYAHQIGASRAMLLYSQEPAPSLSAINGDVKVEAKGLDLAGDPVSSVAALARWIEQKIV
jgi:hypothetical protein